MSDPTPLRVSDQQRGHAAEAIRDHFAAGRLSEDELSERLQAALRAQTEEELQALLADLPPLPVSARQRKAELAERRSDLQRRLLQQTSGGMALFVICAAVWLVDGATGQFWPVWVLIVAVIPLVSNGWRLYGPAPELDRVERELARRERSHHGRRGGRRHGGR